MTGADRGLVICGIAADSPWGIALVAAFGAQARLVPEPLAGAPRPTDLVVAMYGEADRDAADRFEASARAAGACTLSACPGATELLVGPLGVPERAGCGHCARVRMAGAEAAAERAFPPPSPAGAARAAPAHLADVLIDEIAAILRQPALESRLIDHVLVCDAGSMRTSLHRVIPLARCPVCGGAAAWPAIRSPSALPVDDDPESLLAALAGWVDPRTGVISQIALELSGPAGDEPPIIATASPPHAPGPGGALRRLPLGWGKGMTLSSALLSSVGEAIERYAASLPDPERIVRVRRDALRGSVLDPRDCALYSEAQYGRDGFAFRRFDPDMPHPWVLGTWLDSGEPVWVPAVFAFLSLELTPEQQIWQGTSNGLAASTDGDDAALRATLELVERDAFMAAWLTGRSGRRIDVRSLDPPLARVIAGIEALGADVELRVLPTSACGTTALCLALGDGDRYPGVTIGLGADLDPRSAIRQAILELAQTGPHLRRLMRARTPPIPARPEDVFDMIQHAAYYFPVERAAAFDRLRQDPAPIAIGDLAPSTAPRSLASCVTGLAAAGIRVAVVDVTSPDVAVGPFRVVRAVSAQLQPISYGHGLDHPAVERIRAMGLAQGTPPIHPVW